MKTLTIEIPDSLNLDEKETKTFLAAKLYEKGSLSLGQASDMAGYTKREFMELLSRYDVSIFNYSESELENDILNAKNYHC
jgi:predicted HTH domain antitoxin